MPCELLFYKEPGYFFSRFYLTENPICSFCPLRKQHLYMHLDTHTPPTHTHCMCTIKNWMSETLPQTNKTNKYINKGQSTGCFSKGLGVQFPAPKKQLKTICNFNSWGSDTLFSLLWVPHAEIYFQAEAPPPPCVYIYIIYISQKQ